MLTSVFTIGLTVASAVGFVTRLPVGFGLAFFTGLTVELAAGFVLATVLGVTFVAGLVIDFTTGFFADFATGFAAVFAPFLILGLIATFTIVAGDSSFLATAGFTTLAGTTLAFADLIVLTGFKAAVFATLGCLFGKVAVLGLVAEAAFFTAVVFDLATVALVVFAAAGWFGFTALLVYLRLTTGAGSAGVIFHN